MHMQYDDPDNDFHPYNCLGAGDCPHCDEADTADHCPEDCDLCESNGTVFDIDNAYLLKTLGYYED
jgi:hypothetical protein